MENYNLDLRVEPKLQSNFERFRETVENCITSFQQNNLVVESIKSQTFQIHHYHGLLTSIFHQVYFSSTSFAMAGALATDHPEARSYLFHHAEEEKDHWQWILDDLKNTHFKGPPPNEAFPNWAAQAYLAYGVYLAMFNPLGRLAMAAVLEGISGRFGLELGKKALVGLKLNKEQAQFFLAHGELDQGHVQDIFGVLSRSNISPEKWAELEHVALTTEKLYKEIYNFAMR